MQPGSTWKTCSSGLSPPPPPHTRFIPALGRNNGQCNHMCASRRRRPTPRHGPGIPRPLWAPFPGAQSPASVGDPGPAAWASTWPGQLFGRLGSVSFQNEYHRLRGLNRRREFPPVYRLKSQLKHQQASSPEASPRRWKVVSCVRTWVSCATAGAGGPGAVSHWGRGTGLECHRRTWTCPTAQAMGEP